MFKVSLLFARDVKISQSFLEILLVVGKCWIFCRKTGSFCLPGICRSLSNDTKLDGLTVPVNCLLTTRHISVGIFGFLYALVSHGMCGKQMYQCRRLLNCPTALCITYVYRNLRPYIPLLDSNIVLYCKSQQNAGKGQSIEF